MPALDAWIRRVLPAVPVLSRRRWLMLPLDAFDRLCCLPWRELRGLPPNHMRMRIGVGNRLLFNAAHFRLFPINFWFDAVAAGIFSLDSTVVDIGCGCGRFALPLREFDFHGRRFTGRYIGLDIDEEMIGWCRGHFPGDRFEFHAVPGSSRTYGTEGRGGLLPIADASADLIIANSLFTHLLADDFAAYIGEASRMLRPGGILQFSAFVIEDVRAHPTPRWSFRHRAGEAWIENEKYPEAAVAYERAWIEARCVGAGLRACEPLRHHTHTMARWRKG